LAKYKIPTEAERLQEYFWQLQRLIPSPPKDWAKAAKPCKYLKLLEERKLQNGGS
jgi:predicted secreted protein